MSTNKTTHEELILECGGVASLLKSLSHPRRLMLLCHLSDGEKSVTELENLCEASQSQVSQFLARMKGEALVSARRDGKHVYYRISDPKIEKLIQALQKIFCK